MRRLSACFSVLSLIFFISFLSACSQQKLTDFDKSQPEFSLIDFFEGDSLAYGIFEDRFGTLQRRFKVNISGQRTQEEIAGKSISKIILTENFLYEDGEQQQRIWTISKDVLDDGIEYYRGSAGDVIGTAEGGALGSAFFWQYDVSLNISGNNLRVRFSDWIYQMDDYIAINKAKVSKFGIEIGVVTIVFVRGAPASLIGPFNLSEW
ncbi:MAG: DUF3833 family protein [Alphaproteobacteria bacterium]